MEGVKAIESMGSKIITSISIDEELLKRSRIYVARMGLRSFSELVEKLILENIPKNHAEPSNKEGSDAPEHS